MYVGNNITQEQLIKVLSLKTHNALKVFEGKPTQPENVDLQDAKDDMVAASNHAITSVVCLFATPVAAAYGTGTKYMKGEGASRYVIAPLMGAAAGILGIGVGVAGFLFHAAAVPFYVLDAALNHSYASSGAVFSAEQPKPVTSLFAPDAPKIPVTHDITGIGT